VQDVQNYKLHQGKAHFLRQFSRPTCLVALQHLPQHFLAIEMQAADSASFRQVQAEPTYFPNAEKRCLLVPRSYSDWLYTTKGTFLLKKWCFCIPKSYPYPQVLCSWHECCVPVWERLEVCYAPAIAPECGHCPTGMLHCPSWPWLSEVYTLAALSCNTEVMTLTSNTQKYEITAIPQQ